MNDELLQITALKHQRKFVYSNAVHTGLVGGYGSGKSEAGVIKTFIMKLRFPQFPVAYYLPSYQLISDIAYPKFESLFEKNRIRYEIRKGLYEIISDYGRIVFRSMANPQRIVGYEVAYSLIDECDILNIDAMDFAYSKIIARSRCKLPDKEVNKIDVVGTPEGFGWFYNYFVKTENKNRNLIRAKTLDNPYLPESYVNTLQESYTEAQLAAYLNGEFTNLNSGTVYKNFDRHRNYSNEIERRGELLYVGMDFNVTNMNAVIHVIRNGLPIAVDEIVGVYDTLAMIEELKRRYSGKHNLWIYPDATGAARKSSGASDITLLKQAGLKVYHRPSNPFVKDRINAMNVMFLNSKGESKYLVNTNRCPNYTESLEQLPYKNGEPDKTTGHDHITDAGGYFIYAKFPVRPRPLKSSWRE